MDTCFLHYESVNKCEKLLSLSSENAWKTIFEAAKVRGNEKVLPLEKDVKKGNFPSIKFHKSCRSMFTIKRDLDKIRNSQKELKNQQGSASQRTSKRKSSYSSVIFPPQCIFCCNSKYLKGTKTREALSYHISSFVQMK